ncbi:ruvB-like protein 1 isoform X1 [Punica granatum]|uniref:RuvB-like helicase n=1 Tax=Punica granatum TaxID=22663 RepID=A0A218VVT3_PUNGR|nr:ruvB-like protein 1 isoform X1 [Punica granatum]XP_031388709.1 ruvB-like protein 1 isoform X1 [Punica granatum]XP_031388710.1 ruvB-like protein 1 isoform X1 [Punica granatum]OWM64012.1 hypothetical protein CDL15_Pgr006382 [Punica granatum]
MPNPHGILVDLLDRLVIIRAQTYGPTEIIQVEDEESLAYLGKIGQKISLRHAVQLLFPTSVVAKINGQDNICKEVFSNSSRHAVA